jgi:hypothetical protein
VKKRKCERKGKKDEGGEIQKNGMHLRRKLRQNGCIRIENLLIVGAG